MGSGFSEGAKTGFSRSSRSAREQQAQQQQRERKLETPQTTRGSRYVCLSENPNPELSPTRGRWKLRDPSGMGHIEADIVVFTRMHLQAKTKVLHRCVTASREKSYRMVQNGVCYQVNQGYAVS
ncbi:hypothetical protein PoB_006274000 [Plakobranchus ocellatus]|uniref:Uncharacterized protein n=1 Tax=Plakobranchus ocellatus TaxID=259542 RepID=A0AAV4CWH8_9GAST|nr:hypothetical protein PoB_006274000 [Plakobranchus ocellatus]